jgi:3-oxoacyl-[acyl-carrier-protein] synthase-1
MYIKNYCNITHQTTPSLTALYRSLEIDYPKFFKMDTLSKLGFLASELIFRDDKPRFVPREDLAVICFNRSSSLETDTLFQTSIEKENYYPSPSVFVYTLPNIVTGEIAIRNKLYGETFFYLCNKFDAEQIFWTVSNAFHDNKIQSVLAAWIEVFEGVQEAFMMLIENDDKNNIPFSIEEIIKLYNKSMNKQ